jgi:Zn-dependent M28 family amino/carboxypeptidase
MTLDPAVLRSHVETLAAAPRPPGSEALDRARQFVEHSLEQIGWHVRHQLFRTQGLSGTNLLARPTEAPISGRHLIVGAHLDSRPETPGADDNASAVAALLELARHVRNDAADAPVGLELIIFEESGMLGSAHVAGRCMELGADLAGMISLEMLGYADATPGSQQMPEALRALYPDTGDFIGVVGNARSTNFCEQITASMRRTPGLKVESLTVPGNGEAIPPTRLSDHSPFWDRGFPALMITDTSFFRNPHYHTPADTHDTLDFDFLALVTEGVITAVRDAIQS